ncbi:TPA: hypothetical protein ACX3DN_000687 [Vibrio parahaemolyticus]|uniref:hypothetical protein n=1 Tax=Vibrio parahaemolyticus TaxID=670 RepID=UPI0004966170|nr:hypothetical protein [Vibrio parahaemolyticus]MBE3897491.1 hypothetical protein [Vibrio parahaemolyticus]
MKRKAFALTMLTLATANLQAEEIKFDDDTVVTTHWYTDKDTGEGVTLIAKRGDDGPFGMSASVSMSKAGEKRMYFYVSGTSYSCKDDDTFNSDNVANEERSEQIWRFNDTNVRVYAFCADDGMLSATPQTYQGRKFVAKTFMNAKRKVRVTARTTGLNFSADLSALGFSKVWKAFGGDAL